MGRKHVKVRGLVIPIDWDNKGNPTKTAIYGRSEERYTVEPDQKGKELLRFLQQDLDIEGILRETKKGQKIITIKSYWHPLDDTLKATDKENQAFDLDG